LGRDTTSDTKPEGPILYWIELVGLTVVILLILVMRLAIDFSTARWIPIDLLWDIPLYIGLFGVAPRQWLQPPGEE